jgi:hypothetical protein
VKEQLKRHLPWMLGLALMLGVWQKFSWQEVQQAFQQVGWRLPAVLMVGAIWWPSDALSTACLVGYWKGRLLLLEWACDALSTLIPAAGLGGEPFRYRHLASMPLVVTYRSLHAVSGLLATTVAALLVYALGLGAENSAAGWGYLALGGGCVWLILMGLGLGAHRRYWPELPSRRLLGAFLCKVVTRLLQVSEVAVILWALGLPLTVTKLLLVHASLLASASLFVFVPGGLGVQDAALLKGCEWAGYGASVGFQVGVLRRLRQLIWSLLGLSWVFFLERQRAREAVGHGQPV